MNQNANFNPAEEFTPKTYAIVFQWHCLVPWQKDIWISTQSFSFMVTIELCFQHFVLQCHQINLCLFVSGCVCVCGSVDVCPCICIQCLCGGCLWKNLFEVVSDGKCVNVMQHYISHYDQALTLKGPWNKLFMFVYCCHFRHRAHCTMRKHKLWIK